MRTEQRLASRQWMAALWGALGGASVMYFRDPQSGRRRRARLSDRLSHAYREVDVVAGKARRDMRHRMEGLAWRIRQSFAADQADDRVIEERVRSALGHSCSHPGAIEVEARDGRVTLHGSILKNELRRTLDRITTVRGVYEVDGDLTAYEDPSAVPALQGPAGLPQRRESWPPAYRLTGSAAGLALLGAGLSRRGAPGVLLGAAGAGLLARALSDRPLRKLVGIGAGPAAVTLDKTLTIDCPVSEVYAFFRDFENFPRFMSHVKEVQSLGDGRYHWAVEGPGGARFSWDGRITDELPERQLSWRSERGAMIENEGRVRFEALSDDRTRLQIRMGYTPPAGAVGHAVAHLLGADPKQEMDDDLMRFKALMEQGRTRGDGGRVTRDQLEAERHTH